MVLCAIDDLIFSIKISTAARALGTSVHFVRNAAEVLPAVRDQRPSLVIFDLDSPVLDPMGAIRALKSGPDAVPVRTLGYVSHVRADLIAAARDAGIDEVLARSAFVTRLGDILTGAHAAGTSSS